MSTVFDPILGELRTKDSGTGGGGEDGKTILYGAIPPVDGDGQDGDFYINTANHYIYGPKATTWPSGTSLVGPSGAAGTAGNTVLYGATAPVSGGVNGNFYIDTVLHNLHGPKAGGVWPAGTSLVGPAGPVAGADTQLVYNNGGVAAGDSTLTFDNSGKKLKASAIGVNTVASTKLTVAETATTSPRGILSQQFNDGTDAARVGFAKARGTVATPTALLTGDYIGRLMFRGFDGTNYLEMGSIEVQATGTVAATRVPTAITFNTATDATPSVLTPRMTIDNAGNIRMGSATDNLTVSANGNLTVNGQGSLGMVNDPIAYQYFNGL